MLFILLILDIAQEGIASCGRCIVKTAWGGAGRSRPQAVQTHSKAKGLCIDQRLISNFQTVEEWRKGGAGKPTISVLVFGVMWFLIFGASWHAARSNS